MSAVTSADHYHVSGVQPFSLRDRSCGMSSLKSRCLVLASVFLIALHLTAQSTASLGSAENPDDQKARIHRMEATAVDLSIGDNEPPLRLNLQRLMEIYKVPGLSLAVIANFQIIWAKAYGVTEAGSSTPTAPNENRSVRTSSASPRTCSGDM